MDIVDKMFDDNMDEVYIEDMFEGGMKSKVVWVALVE